MSDSETAAEDLHGETLAPPADGERASSDVYPRGTAIGRYVVLGVAGHGGMGVVYRAYDPELQREVALKLLRGRRSTRQSAAEARLRREAQAMARVSHPNVLPVYDVGVFESRAWVAMEFLVAETLGDWLEAAPRTWRDVLAMFVQAGRGLSAAHEVGLVHRDFKPQNVLIGPDGRARVMDFGLARVAAVDSEISADEGDGIAIEQFDTQLTAAGSVVGTPRYMAPEQHFARPIDGRADQFSFCVALYEALYQVRAFVGDSLPELARRKHDGELTEREGRGEVPGWVRKVVVRGLSGEPGDRYGSMRELLAALERDPTVRRKRLLLGAGAGVLAIGAIGGVALLVGGQRPCQDADRKLADIWDDDRRVEIQRSIEGTNLPYAQDTWVRVAATTDAYAQSWTEAHDGACAATKVYGEQSEELLDLRIACLDRLHGELAAWLDVLARADAEVVESAVDSSSRLRPVAQCAATEELLAQTPAPTDPASRATMDRLAQDLARGKALRHAGKADEAIAILEPAAEQARALGYRPLEAEVIGELGDAVGDDGHGARERKLLLEALAAALAGRATRTAAMITVSLCFTDGYQLQSPEDAHAWAELGHGLIESIGGDEHLAGAMQNAEAVTYVIEGDYVRAQRYIDEALARLRAQDRDAIALATINGNVGALLATRGQYASSRRYLDEAIVLHREAYGEHHPGVLNIEANLGALDMYEGHYQDAIVHLERVAAEQELLLGADHVDLSNTLNNLANAQRLSGDNSKAILTHRRALQIRERELGPDSLPVAQTLDNLSIAVRFGGDLKGSRELLERAMAIRAALLPADHIDNSYSQLHLAELCVEEKNFECARAAYDRGVELRERKLGEHHPQTVLALSTRGDALALMGDTTAAIADLERALAASIAAGGTPQLVGKVRFDLAKLLGDRDRPRALRLAGDARSALQSEPSSEQKLAEIDAWLAVQNASDGGSMRAR
ncbi:MAG TPA: serine/threonine-protein kinase [Nannocystaceae bacterium]|nr:serine/threonine-protein kinase [Nannocystaceae bacterium]